MQHSTEIPKLKLYGDESKDFRHKPVDTSRKDEIFVHLLHIFYTTDTVWLAELHGMAYLTRAKSSPSCLVD